LGEGGKQKRGREGIKEEAGRMREGERERDRQTDRETDSMQGTREELREAALHPQFTRDPGLEG
jgi:hypothetical protein